MKIRGLIFDLDYTLYDMSQYTTGAHKLCIKYVSDQLNINNHMVEEKLDQTIKDYGLQYDFLFNEWLKQLDVTDINLVKDCIKVFHSYNPKKLEFYEGAKELLIKSKTSGYKLGVVTDGKSSTQRQKVELLSLRTYVDEILLTDELNTSKPDVVVFQTICNNLSLDPSECLFIGDNPYNDIYGAKKAGLKTARLLKGPFAEEPNVDGIDPDIIFKDINLLLNYI